MKVEQRTRRVAGADQQAVARKGSNRHLQAFDQMLQPLDQRHAARHGLDRVDQDAVAAVGKIEPRAAAGHEHAGQRAESAQSLQPRRARRAAGGWRVARPGAGARPPDRRFSWQALRCWPRRTRGRRPDWPRAHACRRPTTARPAARLSHAPPAADRRTPGNWNSVLLIMARRLLGLGFGVKAAATMNGSLNEALVSPGGNGRSTLGRPKRG